MSIKNKLTVVIVIILSVILSGCFTNIDIIPQNSNNNEIFLRYEYWNINGDQIEQDIQERDRVLPFVESINLNHVNRTNSVTSFINTGNIIDIYSNDKIIMKIELLEVISGKEVSVSINNQEPQTYAKGTVIIVKDSYRAQLIDIIFSDDLLKAGIFINVYSEIRESYPNKLIEDNIGLHRYISSRKETFETTNHTYSNKFVANYGNAIVEVIKNVKFSSLYQDSRNIIEYMENRIYVSQNEEKVAWVSFLEGKEQIIRVNGFYDSIIEAYLKKYPSHISRKTFCERDILLEENDSLVEYFNEKEIMFELKDIDLANLKITMSINREEFVMSQKDHINLNNTIIILDDIEIDTLGMHRVKICLS